MEFLSLTERGMRLRQIRKAKYVSEVEISEYVGISRSCYRSIESGQRDMKCMEVLMISKYLNVHPNRIMGVVAPRIPVDKVRKLAIDNGFDVARQVGGAIDISPRLLKFAVQVVDQVHA